jgi:hypothetical protein
MSATTAWQIGPIKTPSLYWGGCEHVGTTHQCPHCGLILPTGEKPGFCCGNSGEHLHDIETLPPLPHEYAIFISHPQISSLFHVLNLIFSFASLETTHEFPHAPGPSGFLAIQGLYI